MVNLKESVTPLYPSETAPLTSWTETGYSKYQPAARYIGTISPLILSLSFKFFGTTFSTWYIPIE